MLAGFSRQSSVQLCHSLHCGPHYRIPLASGSPASLFRVVTLCSQPYTQEDLGNASLLGLLGSVTGPIAPKTTDAFHSPAPQARARGDAFPSATCTNYNGNQEADAQRGTEELGGDREAHGLSPPQACHRKQSISFQNCFENHEPLG